MNLHGIKLNSRYKQKTYFHKLRKDGPEEMSGFQTDFKEVSRKLNFINVTLFLTTFSFKIIFVNPFQYYIMISFIYTAQLDH